MNKINSQEIAAPSIGAVLLGPSASGRPVTFGGHFGWLHRCSANPSVGVVLVSPIGRDERCTHRPTRIFADQLAKAGYPTLRFDHLSTGDSLDFGQFEDDVAHQWLKNIDAAVAELKSLTGVDRVVLGGFRLGATLAAYRHELADGLLLFSPVLSGRSWLKRLMLSSNLFNDPKAKAADGSPGSPQHPATIVDTDGIHLSAASTKSIEKLDLKHLRNIEAPMFIAEQNGLVGELSTRLIAERSDVSRYAFDEFPDLFLDAHSNLPPLNLFAKSIDWLRMHFPLASLKPLPLASTGDAAFLLPPLSCETSVEFSSGLWGIYCQPQSASTSAPSVLFCNTGGDPRSGIGGFATRAARSLAEKGIASFRFDFAGLGDSDYTETTRCHVYETPRDLDIRAALDVLAQRGHRRVVIAGICAGAYHAFKAGVKDKRIIGILCGSPVKLEWRSGDSLNFNKQILGKSLQSYQTAVLNPQTWARLIRGKIDVVTVASTVGSRWISRIKRRPLKGGTSPLNDIKILNARGVSVEFVAGLGDSSVDELETHFGANYAKLAKLANIRVTVSSEMDHGLARLRSREIVLSRLVQLLTSNDANKPDPQKI